MTKAMKKICAWSLAFVCAATAGIAAIATNGFGLGDPTAQVEQAGHNKQLSFGGFFGNGITLKASADEAASVSDDTVRLTATITPVGASIQTVDWNVAWKNPSSTWASGKKATDYVKITPTEDGALTADVECKQAFGEQVMVTVTSRDDPTLTANCTVDYAKRIQAVTFGLTHYTQEGSSSVTRKTYTTDEDFIVFDDKHLVRQFAFDSSFVPSYEYSVGTLEPEYSLTLSYFATLDEELLTDISAEIGYTLTIETRFLPEFAGNQELTTYTSLTDVYRANNMPLGQYSIGNNAEAALRKYIYDNQDVSLFSIRVKASSEYSTFEKDLRVLYNPDMLYTPAENVSLDKSAIVL